MVRVSLRDQGISPVIVFDMNTESREGITGDCFGERKDIF